MLRSLRARVLAGYGIVLLLVAIVVAVALGTTSRLGASGETLLRRNYASIRAADGMAAALEQIEDGERSGAAAGHAQAAAADSFRVWHSRAAANVTETGERDALGQITSVFTSYRRAVFTGDTLSQHASARAVLDAVARLRTINQTAMIVTSTRTRADARRAFQLILLVGAAALVVGFVFSTALASALVRPLRAMQVAADTIARGRYDVDLPAPTDDDLGGLARAMSGMARALRDYDALNIDRLLAEKRKTDAVLQAMDDGLVVVDSGMRVAAANPAAERVLGRITPGRLLDDVVGDRALVASVRSALAYGRGEGTDAPSRFVADTRGLHVQYVVTALVGPPGGPPTAIVLLRDLTRLREAEKAKNAFLQATSHELRTPLTGLEMALGMLRTPVGERLGEQDRELFQVALDEQRRLSTLVASLLDLARMEAGEAALHRSPLDIRAILDETSVRFAAQAAAQKVTVQVEPGPPVPEVLGDPSRLSLVVSNLVANALRYVTAGGHVLLAATVTKDDTVRLTVTDDGPGVPPEWRDRIFEPLAQIDDRPAGSSGLGLAICRAVVEAHGGAIYAEPSPGGGASFVVVLPSKTRT